MSSSPTRAGCHGRGHRSRAGAPTHVAIDPAQNCQRRGNGANYAAASLRTAEMSISPTIVPLYSAGSLYKHLTSENFFSLQPYGKVGTVNSFFNAQLPHLIIRHRTVRMAQIPHARSDVTVARNQMLSSLGITRNLDRPCPGGGYSRHRITLNPGQSGESNWACSGTTAVKARGR